ncbi:VRR-NUC domain protein [compost metagenome]
MIRIYDSGYRGDCRVETIEQIDCASWLQFNYPERWPLIWHTPNESKATASYMQKRQKMGVKSGVSDIIDFGLVRGAFELKRLDKSKCKVSKEQREFLQAVADSGGFAAVVYGFQEFKRAYADYLDFVRLRG